jgi:hypothetical protein
MDTCKWKGAEGAGRQHKNNLVHPDVNCNFQQVPRTIHPILDLQIVLVTACIEYGYGDNYTMHVSMAMAIIKEHGYS